MFAEEGRGLVHAASGALADRAHAALPWTLTADQEQALAEIVADLASRRPMHRLLVGDVGSGKTVVALLAALHVIEAGHQVAFMAPTEILARQHAGTLTRFARPAGVEVLALTGGSSAGERRVIRTRVSRRASRCSWWGRTRCSRRKSRCRRWGSRSWTSSTGSGSGNAPRWQRRP